MTEEIVAALNDDERRVMIEMSDEIGWPFARLAEWSGVDVARVRKIVRSFKQRGLAEYGVLFDEDEPFVRGSGYWLNGRGYKVQSQLPASERPIW